VPQGPHFADKPYWVTIDEKREASCVTLDPAGLVLRLARVRAQNSADVWPRDTHSFHRAYARLEIIPFTVAASGEGVINPHREYYAVVKDSLLVEVERLFGNVIGSYGDTHQVLSAVAYDYYSRELEATPTADEHRQLLAMQPEALAALVAPSL
jgi:hypothetical protein